MSHKLQVAENYRNTYVISRHIHNHQCHGKNNEEDENSVGQNIWKRLTIEKLLRVNLQIQLSHDRDIYVEFGVSVLNELNGTGVYSDSENMKSLIH